MSTSGALSPPPVFVPFLPNLYSRTHTAVFYGWWEREEEHVKGWKAMRVQGKWHINKVTSVTREEWNSSSVSIRQLASVNRWCCRSGQEVICWQWYNSYEILVINIIFIAEIHYFASAEPLGLTRPRKTKRIHPAVHATNTTGLIFPSYNHPQFFSCVWIESTL